MTDATNKAPTAPHQRPAWMTAEWLAREVEQWRPGGVHSAASVHSEGWPRGHMADEILHLDAELASAVGSLDSLRNAINDYDGAPRDREIKLPVGRAIGIIADLRAELAERDKTIAKLQDSDWRRVAAFIECAMAAQLREADQTVTPAMAETFPRAIAEKLHALTARAEKAEADLASVTLTGDSVAIDSANAAEDRAQAQRDASIRDRNEFAAREVERFARDLWDNNHLLYRMPCDAAAAHRAVELRAGAVPDHVADGGKKVETTTLREPSPGNATLAIRVGANTMWSECAIEKLGESAAFAAGVMMRRHGAVPAADPLQPHYRVGSEGKLEPEWLESTSTHGIQKLQAATEPKPEPAAEPPVPAWENLVQSARRSWANGMAHDAFALLCSALEHVARKVQP